MQILLAIRNSDLTESCQKIIVPLGGKNLEHLPKFHSLVIRIYNLHSHSLQNGFLPLCVPLGLREASQMLCKLPDPIPSLPSPPAFGAEVVVWFQVLWQSPSSASSLVHLGSVLWLVEVAGMTCQPLRALNQFYSCFPNSHWFPWELMTW